MKRLEEIPAAALESIKTEHERAMAQVLKQYKYFATLPVRPVRMKLLRQSADREDFEETIIPATEIHVKPGGFIGKSAIDRDALTYCVAGTKKPFPYGHIYQGSGHLCLGSIFVPSKVPIYSPQQPLETLFLHNDRNLNHGGASLQLTEDSINGVRDILSHEGVELSKDADEALVAKNELLEYDGIWLIGADVYTQFTLQKAVKIMASVYDVIFQRKEQL